MADAINIQNLNIWILHFSFFTFHLLQCFHKLVEHELCVYWT